MRYPGDTERLLPYCVGEATDNCIVKNLPQYFCPSASENCVNEPLMLHSFVKWNGKLHSLFAAGASEGFSAKNV